MGRLSKLMDKWEREGFEKEEFRIRHPVLKKISSELRHGKVILAVQLSLFLSLIWFTFVIIGGWLNPAGNTVKENFKAASLSEQWSKLGDSEKKQLIDQVGREKLKSMYKSFLGGSDKTE